MVSRRLSELPLDYKQQSGRDNPISRWWLGQGRWLGRFSLGAQVAKAVAAFGKISELAPIPR
jgi:hypothetical protein